MYKSISKAHESVWGHPLSNYAKGREEGGIKMRIGGSGIYFFALFTMAGTNVLKRALDLKHTKANQLNKERPIGAHT